MTIQHMAWAWTQPVSAKAKLALLALADGRETVEDVAKATSLTSVEVIEAFSEIARTLAVLWLSGRPYFRLGEVYRDRNDRTPEEA